MRTEHGSKLELFRTYSFERIREACSWLEVMPQLRQAIIASLSSYLYGCTRTSIATRSIRFHISAFTLF